MFQLLGETMFWGFWLQVACLTSQDKTCAQCINTISEIIIMYNVYLSSTQFRVFAVHDTCDMLDHFIPHVFYVTASLGFNMIIATVWEQQERQEIYFESGFPRLWATVDFSTLAAVLDTTKEVWGVNWQFCKLFSFQQQQLIG